MNWRRRPRIKSKPYLRKSIIVCTKMDRVRKMRIVPGLRILLAQSIRVFQKKWRVNVPFGDKGFHIWGKSWKIRKSKKSQFSEIFWKSWILFQGNWQRHFVELLPSPKCAKTSKKCQISERFDDASKSLTQSQRLFNHVWHLFSVPL